MWNINIHMNINALPQEDLYLEMSLMDKSELRF